MNGAEQNHTFAERHLKSGEAGKGLAFEAKPLPEDILTLTAICMLK